MEKKFDHQNADDLLCGSYCAGIQKIAAITNASYNNFQIPQNILEERKKAWNDLFQKYLSMVSGAELNVHTLQPECEMNLSKKIEQRLPMRKSMSMVQYWVETGNLAHSTCSSVPVGLASESSKVDNKLKLTQNVYFPSSITGSSAEKHSNFAETLENKIAGIVTSNSSIDTAAYILANNYVTKKLETIAIVEGSKVTSEIQSHPKNFPEILEINKSKHYNSLASKNNFNKLNMENTDSSQSILFTSCIDKISENMKNANLDNECSSKMISKQENRICSIFSSDSDESRNPNVENYRNLDSDIRYNLSKAVKRKKLYKRSDSPAEFTPVSEDNLSFKMSRFTVEKYLPLRSSEHPALETPKMRKFERTKSKRKLDQDQGFSSLCTSASTNNSISVNHEILDLSNQNNTSKPSSNKFCTTISKPIASQTISKDEYIQKNYFHKRMNSMRQSLKQQNKIDKAFVSTLGECNSFLEPKFELKSCQVVIQRLPYKYYLSSSNEQIPKNNKSFGTMKYCVCTQDFIKNPPDYILKSNITSTKNASSSSYSAKSLPENTSDFRTHNFKKFGDIHIVQDKLGYEGKQSKFPEKKNYIYSLEKFKISDIKNSASNIHPIGRILTKHSQMKNKKNLCKIKSKYVIADSSSDESDLIVPLSINKNQLKSKSRNTEKLLNRSLSHQLSKSETNIFRSIITIESDNNSNSSTHNNSSYNFSKAQKISSGNFFENYEIGNDMQYNEVEENSYLDTSKYIILPSDCNKQKYKIKNMSITSLSGRERKKNSIPTRKQLKTLKLAVKCKQSAKSTHATFRKYKNISNNVTNEMNNKAKINNKSPKVKSVCDKLNIFDDTPNKKKKQESPICLNDDNLETLFEFALINTVNDDELRSTCANVSEDSIKLGKNELSFTKTIEKGGGQPYIKDLVQIVGMITQKISTKKRSSYEIELSSDEECIIPLKKFINKE